MVDCGGHEVCQSVASLPYTTANLPGDFIGRWLGLVGALSTDPGDHEGDMVPSLSQQREGLHGRQSTEAKLVHRHDAVSSSDLAISCCNSSWDNFLHLNQFSVLLLCHWSN